MKRKCKNLIVYLFMVTLLSVALYGCTDDQETAIIPQKDYPVKISLKTSRMFTRSPYSTRATESDPDDFESRIDENDILLLLFDNSGELLEVIYDSGSLTGVSPLAQSDEAGNFIMNLSDGMAGSVTTITALVNISPYIPERELPQNVFASSDKLAEFIYKLPEDGLNEGNLIPMWGTLDITLSTTPEDNRQIEVEIPLKRLFAKIEIIDLLNEGEEITGAVLSQYNTSGTLCPGKNPEEGSISTARNLTFNKRPQTGNDSKSLFYAYVPETILSDNTDADDRKILLTVISGTEEKTCLLYIKNYSTGENDEWDSLLANNIYRFYVTGIEQGEAKGYSDIRIVWVNFGRGKFHEDNVYVNFRESGSTTPLWSRNQVTQQNYMLRFPGADQDEQCIYFDLNLTDEGLSGTDGLYYAVMPGDNPDLMTDLRTNDLMKDVVASEIHDDEKRVYLWLTSYPLRSSDPVNNDDNFRIYWKSEKPIVWVDINYDTYEGDDIKTDTERNYQYIDFKYKDFSNGMVNYDIYDGSTHLTPGNPALRVSEFFPITESGTVYYVFYVN